MAIYSGNNNSETKAPPLPVCVYMNNMYLQKVEVVREDLKTTGLRLHLYSEGYFFYKKSLIRNIR